MMCRKFCDFRAQNRDKYEGTKVIILDMSLTKIRYLDCDYELFPLCDRVWT